MYFTTWLKDYFGLAFLPANLYFSIPQLAEEKTHRDVIGFKSLWKEYLLLAFGPLEANKDTVTAPKENTMNFNTNLCSWNSLKMWYCLWKLQIRIQKVLKAKLCFQSPPQNTCKKKGWREGRKGGGGEEWHLLPFKGTQLHDQAVYLQAQRKAESEYDIEEKSTQAT